jgi:FkbM family methyltransferase
VYSRRNLNNVLGSVAVVLGRHQFLHRLIETSGIYTVACWVLAHHPIYRTDKSSGILYRATSPDQFSVEREIFVERSYGMALDFLPFDTVIDLGCNAGWFSLWLAAETASRTRRALLVDANPAMADEASWHIDRNGLVHHHVIHGAVGLPSQTPNVVFHVYRAASASSLLQHQPRAQLPTKGLVGNITVPALSVANEWAALFGDSLVDLLKVDIEGQELDLVRNEGSFISSHVRTAIIEWHKWKVTLTELDAALGDLDFVRKATSHESTFAGIALYRNSTQLGA